ncbi:hypothetical protein ACFOL3_21050 [Streptomyces nitrosporeus]|uniref:hypothetical protein n=1 Tax=Streptomyces nitrosporeus TaxID=28894 RepID=UPI0036125E59
MRRTGTTRRSALTASGALALGAVLTGCGGGDPDGGRTAAAGARAASARAALRASAARSSRALAARYAQVAADHPATAAGLAPLQEAVRAHAAAFSADAPPRPEPTAPSPVPSAAPAGDAGAALRELAAEERRVAGERAEALLTAEPELARLLASVAAAGAVHAYLLTGLAEEATA